MIPIHEWFALCCVRVSSGVVLYLIVWAPDITRLIFSKQLTKDAHSSGRSMVVFREFLVWPKFHLQICCALFNVVLYCTAIYRESVEWPIAFGITNTIDTVPMEQLWIICVNIYMHPCAIVNTSTATPRAVVFHMSLFKDFDCERLMYSA